MSAKCLVLRFASLLCAPVAALCLDSFFCAAMFLLPYHSAKMDWQPLSTAASSLGSILLHHRKKTEKQGLLIPLCSAMLLCIASFGLIAALGALRLYTSDLSQLKLHKTEINSLVFKSLSIPFFYYFDFIRGFLSHFFTWLLWCCPIFYLSLPKLTRMPPRGFIKTY